MYVHTYGDHLLQCVLTYWSLGSVTTGMYIVCIIEASHGSLSPTHTYIVGPLVSISKATPLFCSVCDGMMSTFCPFSVLVPILRNGQEVVV